MGKRIYRSIKRGFVSGVRSVLSINMHPEKRNVHYLNRTTDQAIRRHWEDVGQYINGAMHKVGGEIKSRDITTNSDRIGARQHNKEDEQREFEATTW